MYVFVCACVVYELSCYVTYVPSDSLILGDRTYKLLVLVAGHKEKLDISMAAEWPTISRFYYLLKVAVPKLVICVLN